MQGAITYILVKKEEHGIVDFLFVLFFSDYFVLTPFVTRSVLVFVEMNIGRLGKWN